MSPRTAGAIAIVVALTLAVFAGTLFVSFWAGIVGAVLLLVAAVLFPLGARWTFRTSWAETTFPPRGVPDSRELRRLRRGLVVFSVVTPLIIGGAVAGVAAQQSWGSWSMLGGGAVALIGALGYLQALHARILHFKSETEAEGPI